MFGLGQEVAYRFRRLAPPVQRLTAVILSVVASGCGREYPQTTIDPVTSDLGASIQDLYITVFWWTMLILVVVWGLLAFIVIRFRERPGGGEPTKTRGSLVLEIGWTAVPAIIVAAIMVPTIDAVFKTQRRPPDDALVVEVIGHQWWWEFRYPAQGIVTANELHLPTGRTVALRLSSADVIHSFWAPRLGGKRDLNPLVRKPEGQEPGVNRLSFTVDEPGVYYGQCAEFCGLSHTFMGMRVIAQPPAAFEEWAQEMRTPVAPDPESPTAQGEQVFMSSLCVACHAIAGTNAQGTLGPSLTRFGARMTIGAGLLENTRENLVSWIRDPGALKPGVKMPGAETGGGGMPPTGLSEEQVQAVASYLLSLR